MTGSCGYSVRAREIRRYRSGIESGYWCIHRHTHTRTHTNIQDASRIKRGGDAGLMVVTFSYRGCLSTASSVSDRCEQRPVVRRFAGIRPRDLANGRVFNIRKEHVYTLYIYIHAYKSLLKLTTGRFPMAEKNACTRAILIRHKRFSRRNSLKTAFRDYIYVYIYYIDTEYTVVY